MGVFAFRLAPAGMFVVAAVLAFIGCGQAAAQTAVRVTLDRRIEGPSAPFLVALDRGYYRNEGLDVTIEPSAGMLEPITRLVNGSHDIGVADLNALIKFRDGNAAAPKAVFIIDNKPAYAIVARRSRGIAQPKDLEGKKLGGPVGNLTFAQWPLFAKLNDIDTAKVAIENVGVAVREPMLAAGQVDAVTGFAHSAYVDLKHRGVPLEDVVVLSMADHGLVLYGNAIVVNGKFATEKPEAVRAFLRAYVNGLKETLRDPQRAIDSVLSRNESASREIELERLQMVLRDNIATPEVRSNGVGGVDTSRLGTAIDQLGLTYKFRTKPSPADAFDPSFLPDPAERKLD
jgi:NitT/TauT family transport system substrate-binding protein